MEGKDIAIVRESTIQRLDSIKKLTDKGIDFWFGRDLQSLFGYTEWRNFKEGAIAKARMACSSVGGIPSHHFGDVTKMMVTVDAHHLLLQIQIEEESDKYWRVVSWQLRDLYNLKVSLKTEWNANYADFEATGLLIEGS